MITRTLKQALITVILLLTVMLLSVGYSLPRENTGSIITDVSTVAWSPYPGVPEGAELAVLRGEPNKEPSDSVARLPAGYLFPHHYHTSRELLIFLEGDFTYIMDDGTARDLSANAYLSLPSGTRHSVRCGSEPCLLYAHYDGPYDLILVPPPGTNK